MLQTAVNPYVALLGPIESAAKRISIMGVANKLAGAFSGIIIGGLLLTKSNEEIDADLLGLTEALKIDYLNDLASKVIGPYVLMAAVLLFLALRFACSFA